MLAQVNKNLQAYIPYISSDTMIPKPATFDVNMVTTISKELLDEPYGWGGLLNTRDCSSILNKIKGIIQIY